MVSQKSKYSSFKVLSYLLKSIKEIFLLGNLLINPNFFSFEWSKVFNPGNSMRGNQIEEANKFHLRKPAKLVSTVDIHGHIFGTNK